MVKSTKSDIIISIVYLRLGLAYLSSHNTAEDSNCSIETHCILCFFKTWKSDNWSQRYRSALGYSRCGGWLLPWTNGMNSEHWQDKYFVLKAYICRRLVNNLCNYTNVLVLSFCNLRLPCVVIRVIVLFKYCYPFPYNTKILGVQNNDLFNLVPMCPIILLIQERKKQDGDIWRSISKHAMWTGIEIQFSRFLIKYTVYKHYHWAHFAHFANADLLGSLLN